MESLLANRSCVRSVFLCLPCTLWYLCSLFKKQQQMFRSVLSLDSHVGTALDFNMQS